MIVWWNTLMIWWWCSDWEGGGAVRCSEWPEGGTQNVCSLEFFELYIGIALHSCLSVLDINLNKKKPHYLFAHLHFAYLSITFIGQDSEIQTKNRHVFGRTDFPFHSIHFPWQDNCWFDVNRMLNKCKQLSFSLTFSFHLPAQVIG